MSSNRRIFYAVQQGGIAPDGSNTFTSIHGLQSVGINTRFNLEQVFEIGQIAIYQNIENIPDIEITAEKVLDGYPLIYHLATYPSTSASLSGRSAARAQFGLSIYTDTQNSASGTPLAQCVCSGVFVQQLTYTIPTQGNATEQVTLVGNNKIWNKSFTATAFTNTDIPAAAEGVNRRQNIKFGEGTGTICYLPLDIPGVTASGTNPLQVDGSFAAHIQSIRVSANLGREALYELGHRGVYFRYVQFPVQVQSDFEVLSSQGDNVTALENATSNVTGRKIYLEMTEGTKLDLGTQNKLQSVTYGGANAGTQGGNATQTFSYITFNDLTVTHPQDPSGL
jgi:hypothetical protein